MQTLLALAAKLNFDRQAEIVVVLLDRAACDELTAACADDEVVASEFRNARSLDPASHELHSGPARSVLHEHDPKRDAGPHTH